MKIYTEKEVDLLLNKLAAYYSMSQDKSFDKGFNETVKIFCKEISGFKEIEGIAIEKYNMNLLSCF